MAILRAQFQKNTEDMYEADILKSRIIAAEFSKSNTPGPMGGKGIDMLVPTLLEMGTKEQKQAYIKPHSMEK